MADGTQAEPEVPLATGGVTDVVRVGDTVRRPARPFTASVHAYLGHIRSRGFDGAPQPLGYDERGREVLSYVEGGVPGEPLPDWAAGDTSLAVLARLIRDLHEASADFVAPPDAVWGSVPGMTAPGVVPLFEHPELVSHQDYFPGNVVFRDGRPAALIDFDLARPTTRLSDIANALFWWAPLLDPVDRAPALALADAAERVRIFADAYGVTRAMRTEIVAVALQRTRNNVVQLQAAAQFDPVFRRWWDEGGNHRLPRAVDWLAAEAEWITARLLD